MAYSFLYYYSKCRYEFKINHGEWVSTTKPFLGPGINERVWEAVRATDDKIDICHSVRTELRAALASLLGVYTMTCYDNSILYFGNIASTFRNANVLIPQNSITFNPS